MPLGEGYWVVREIKGDRGRERSVSRSGESTECPIDWRKLRTEDEGKEEHREKEIKVDDNRTYPARQELT